MCLFAGEMEGDVMAPAIFDLTALAKFFVAATRPGTAGYLVARCHARDAGLLDAELRPTEMGERVIRLATGGKLRWEP